MKINLLVLCKQAGDGVALGGAVRLTADLMSGNIFLSPFAVFLCYKGVNSYLLSETQVVDC